MTMSDSLDGALAGLPPLPRDGGTVALAREYARLIDLAGPAAKYEEALAWLAGQGADDRDSDRHIRTIRNALAAHSVASDLGPKLLAALEALQMSPRARAMAHRGEVKDVPARNPLDQLAARRAGKSRADDGHAAAT